MKGDIKQVAEHLANDKQLQKSMDFFPCDANGVAIQQTEETIEAIKKKVAEVAVSEPTIIIPEGVQIVNPLDEVVVKENPYEKDSIEAKIFDLYAGGMNAEEIKEQIGANKNTINKVIKATK